MKKWEEVKPGEKVSIEGIPNELYLKLEEPLSFTNSYAGHDSTDLNAVEISSGKPCTIPDSREVEVVKL
ncbi:MAG: hypothetical protein PHR36_01720 [Patescibacteria group bacterium]|nr:hypothetical protein [Patescibacteria group bacterium]